MDKSVPGLSRPQTETKELPHADDAHAESATTPLPKAVERRILRKLDLTLIPILWFLFLVCFIDRGNIGNAKISGMVTSLHLVGNRYNIAFQAFVLAYVLFGVPATILFKALGPRMLPVMMFFWGLCVVGQGVTKSYAGLVVCRFLEGMMEAGFVPGAAYLIGCYYKGDEFLKRYAFFFGASIVAGAFNGVSSLIFIFCIAED
jgi:MFS family permease